MSIRVIAPLGHQPNVPDEKYLMYLDELRDSGQINMFAAGPWLARSFPELSFVAARGVVVWWMEHFEERHPA